MNKAPSLNRIRGSVFLKISCIFVLGIAAFSLAMKLTHDRFFRQPRLPKIQRMAVTSALNMLPVLGHPPLRENALMFRDSLGIYMRFEHDSLSWTTLEALPASADVNVPAYPGDAGIRAGFDEGLMVVLPVDGGRLLVALHLHNEGLQYTAEIYSLINLAILGLVIAFMYMAVRIILKPIKDLNVAVERLAAGNLDIDVATRRRDELGRLMLSFSAMAARIREMLAARDQLLMDVSHELRSPLTRVKLSLEMMQPCDERQEIQQDIEEMETMVSELLETERLKSHHGALELEQFDWSKDLLALQAEFTGQAPGVEVALPPSQFIVADRKRLRICISNLIANALKYSADESSPVRLTLQEDQGEVRVTVENHGQVIPEDELPFVFEPFYRIDKSRTKSTGGYGLGLSLARRIAEAHGGTLVLENVAGHGVRAVLTLPPDSDTL